MIKLETINGFAYVTDSDRGYKVFKRKVEGQIYVVLFSHANFMFTGGLDETGLYPEDTLIVERGSARKFSHLGDLGEVCEHYFPLAVRIEDCFYPTIAELKEYLNLKYGI